MSEIDPQVKEWWQALGREITKISGNDAKRRRLDEKVAADLELRELIPMSLLIHPDKSFEIYLDAEFDFWDGMQRSLGENG